MLDTLAKDIENRSFPLSFPGHWIGRSWHQSARPRYLGFSENPNRPERIIEFGADSEIITKAMDSAEQSRPFLAKLNIEERLELLSKFRQCLGDFSKTAIDIMRIEAGKPKWEADLDFAAAISHLDHTISQGKELFDSILAPARLSGTKNTEYELCPVGVTLAYLPFSSPITSLVHFLCGSVVAGCPIIINTGHHAALTGLMTAMMAEKLEWHPGIVNVVFGNFDVFKQFFGDRRIKGIIYTGSRDHCTTIRRDSLNFPGRELILQSGGKNSVIVHSSADLDEACNIISYGAFKSSGQLCSATSRVFVYHSLVEEFSEKIAEKVNALKIGASDTEEDVALGPLYAQKAVDKFLRFQTMAHREAENDICWGKSVDSKDGGNFVRPGVHLMKNFDPKSAYQDNVLLCPDICVYKYEKLDEAIGQITQTDAPFVIGFIGDAEKMRQRTANLRAPNLVINRPTAEINATMPLSGRRHCGQNRYNGLGIATLLAFPRAIDTGWSEIEKGGNWPWG